MKGLDETSLYGYSYLTRRFQEKPFFLGVDGISAEREEGGTWKLSFNPVHCDVYDNTSLEDLLIFLLHVRHYNFIIDDSFNSTLFDFIQFVLSKILDKIMVEINFENNLELDKTMTAYNLFAVMVDILLRVYPVLRYQNSEKQTRTNLNKVKQFTKKFLNHGDVIVFFIGLHNQLSFLLNAVTSNLIFHLTSVLSFIENNDLKTLNAKIMPCLTENENLSVSILDKVIDDPFFVLPIMNVEIFEDIINITSYRLSDIQNSEKIENEILDATFNVRTFNNYNQYSIIDEKNLSNYNDLVKLCGDSNQIPVSNIDHFRKITKYFDDHFWERREKTNEIRESILFKPEETEFIFQFTIKVFDYLKRISKDYPHKELLRENLSDFGFILNSLRYLEIYDAISLETSFTLSKTLDDLIINTPVVSLMDGMPGTVLLISSKIISFLGFSKKHTQVMELEDERIYPPFRLTTVKPIEEVGQISKIRKFRWKEILADNDTEFFNQDECPVCYNEQQKYDSCILVCKHTLCSSCTEKVIDGTNMPQCPVCRCLLSEFLPGGKLEDISQALQ